MGYVIFLWDSVNLFMGFCESFCGVLLVFCGVLLVF